MSNTKPRLSPEQISDIIQRYLSGASIKEIHRQRRYTEQTIHRQLIRAGISLRSLSEAKRTLSLNESAFDELTPEARYWIGFLFADGTIRREKNNSDKIRLVLSSIDILHVEKFKRFVGAQHKISSYSSKNAAIDTGLSEFCFRSNKIGARLRELGLLGKQGHIPSDDLKMCPHFWRGVVDGDGHVGIHNCGWKLRPHPSLELCINKKMGEQFLNFVHTFVPDTKVKISWHRGIYRVRLVGKTAYPVIKSLYENSSVYLERKRHVADKILNTFSY